MSAGIERLTDTTTGHGSWPSTYIITASPNVFINGLGAARLKDIAQIHCDNDNNCHYPEFSKTSATVFVNGLGVATKVSSYNCGDTPKSMSPNVFAS